MIKKDKNKYEKGHTFYYSDPLNDDFEENTLKRVDLPKDFKYLNKNIFARFLSFLIYYGLCKTILGSITFFRGTKVVGKEKLKKLKKEGAFVYSNHTSFFDVFDKQCLALGAKRCDILGYTDALSFPWFIRKICLLIGYVPLPTSIKDYKKFDEYLQVRIKEEKKWLIIYPEAHIWPLYTGLREFPSVSFKYPAKFSLPVVPICTCYRKVRGFKKPKPTLFILDPIYPKKDLSINENKEYLRDECFKNMKKCIEENSTYAYYNYIYREKENDKQI